MTTVITVPSGTGSTTVSLTFATSATAALATTLLSSVYAAAAAGTLSPDNEFVVTAPGAYTIPAGVSTVVDAAEGAVTLTGNGVYGVAAGSGNLNLMSTGGSGTVVAGAGSDTFVGSNYALLGDAFTTGFLGGSDSVTTGVFTLTGLSPTITALGVGAIIFGSDSPSNGDFMTNDGTGPNTFLVDAGSTTVNALSAGGLYYQNGGQLLFINNAQSTVVGLGGAATVFGGSADFTLENEKPDSSVLFVGGSGNATLVGGAGGSIVAFGGAGGSVTVLDQVGTGAGTRLLIGGAGSETLNAAGSTANTVIYGGSGNDVVFLGNTNADRFVDGSGSATVVAATNLSLFGNTADIFDFVNLGSSGGNAVIFNFNPNNVLEFLGFGTSANAAITTAIAGAGSGHVVSFSLPDQTKVTLVGVDGTTINPSSNPIRFS